MESICPSGKYYLSIKFKYSWIFTLKRYYQNFLTTGNDELYGVPERVIVYKGQEIKLCFVKTKIHSSLSYESFKWELASDAYFIQILYSETKKEIESSSFYIIFYNYF